MEVRETILDSRGRVPELCDPNQWSDAGSYVWELYPELPREEGIRSAISTHWGTTRKQTVCGGLPFIKSLKQQLYLNTTMVPSVKVTRESMVGF